MGIGGPSDRALRSTFEEVADHYDGVRPELPSDWLDTVVARAELPAGGRVLEIGCGTGRATAAMAAKGFEVVALELGEQLAAIAARKLAPFPKVRVERTAFEEWPAPVASFDLVIAIMAWHWLDPAVALSKAATVIRPGGALAIVAGGHVAGGDTDFFDEVQACYGRHMPGAQPGERLRSVGEIPHREWGIASTAEFGVPVYRRWVQVDEYTTTTYFDLLRTFSSHIALAPADRDALFACIRERMVSKYGGRIRRATLTELCVARRA